MLYSSSHPSHVKNSIPYSQFLRICRLCSEDSDFSLKSDEMCDFFDKSGYPASVIQASRHHAQLFDRQSALQTSQKENSDRIPLTLKFQVRGILKDKLGRLWNYLKSIFPCCDQHHEGILYYFMTLLAHNVINKVEKQRKALSPNPTG